MKKLGFTHSRKLDQHEMKKIKGAEDAAQSTFESAGNATCYLTTYGKSGDVRDIIVVPNSNSSQANEYCVELIITQGTGVYRCTFRCDYPN